MPIVTNEIIRLVTSLTENPAKRLSSRKVMSVECSPRSTPARAQSEFEMRTGAAGSGDCYRGVNACLRD